LKQENTMTKQIQRDARDYDKTQLRETGHGNSLHRDYSAHFFRWSFARRYIRPSDSVLEVGCGQDLPLYKILTGGAARNVDTYLGVDLNKLKAVSKNKNNFFGEFNFVEDYAKVKAFKPEGFDVLVTFEVIEHMRVDLGAQMLSACFECLKPGGTMLISTPCYDGVRHAVNHIHEYTVPELQDYLIKAGFVVNARYGTFMDIKHFKQQLLDDNVQSAVDTLMPLLSKYFDSNAVSNIFAPLYPDHSRNNLWVCHKPY